jgi:peptidoglycan hydrolase-like protein with peptidoglycan-binding domain
MTSSRAGFIFFISAVLSAAPVYAAHVHRSTTSGQTTASHRLSQSKRRVASSRRVRGQQAIEPERVTQIQEALIRQHYLSAPSNGKWDPATVAAMRKYQADHGWQTKLMPDSRALKNLGLGPDYSNAINAQGANFSVPATGGGAAPAMQTAGFTEASGVKQ